MQTNRIMHNQDTRATKKIGLGLGFKLVIAFAVVLILALLATLVYLIAPGPVTKMQTTAVNDFYSNTEPPSIPKWASSDAARGVTFIQPATVASPAAPVSDEHEFQVGAVPR